MAAAIFITGATGLLGARVLERLLREHPSHSATALVRDEQRWRELRAALGTLGGRVRPAFGDLRAGGLALDRDTRRSCARGVSVIVHLAADTTFSLPLEEARAVNTAGTARLLDVARSWPGVRRFVHVSTAFVAGARTGRVLEDETVIPPRWVNGYEQSKHEAEALVRASGIPWTILRPSTVVCDDVAGAITQHNAIHRALRLYHHGLAPMMPHAPGTAVDVVPADYVCDAIASLALRADAIQRTFHLCAGDAALPLDELLDVTYEVWAADPTWRRRGVTRPALCDLETYRLFESSVDEVADRRLCQVMRSLSHFVPQLALPKRFDTSSADAALGARAPAPRLYWRRMVEGLSLGSGVVPRAA